jgi:ABC-2 type transport system permease protein
MNPTKILRVAQKSLRELVREPMILALVVLLPAFFMLITYIGYGSAPKTATFALGVISHTPKAEKMIQQLQQARYSDDRPIFSIVRADDRLNLETALKEQRAAVGLIFDEDSDGELKFTVRGDALNMAYTKASVQMEAVLIPLMEAAQGKPHGIDVIERPIGLARPISDFDAYAPGMMVFAILLLIPQTAMLVAREMRWGTLKRLELTLVTPAELLCGISLAQLVIAVAQSVIMIAAALALGFHNRGSLALAVGIACVLALGSIGFGLVMACVVRNDSDALNSGSAVSMVMVFLSGAFFAMPTPTLCVWFDHAIGIFDWIPATHGMLALQEVMVGGAGLEQVAFRVLACLVLSIFYLILGIWIFTLRRRAM